MAITNIESTTIDAVKYDNDNDAELILKCLKRYKVLTIEQVIDIFMDGQSRSAYYIIDKLKGQGMIRAERLPDDNRSKYIVLTKKGAEVINEDIKVHEYYVRKENVEEYIMVNEIHRILYKAGLKDIKHRREALKELNLKHNETNMRWLFKSKGPYAIYTRKRGNKKFIEKSVKNAPINKIKGHIIIYDNARYLREDRRDWLKHLPCPSLYMTTMVELPDLITVLQNPTAHLTEFTEKLITFVSTGTLIQTKDAPLPYAWQKGKSRMLLCDLTTGDITCPALMLPNSEKQLKERGWGDGVIYYVEDKRAARTWSRLLKRRECNYFIAKKDTSLYGIKAGKLVQMA